ncbi:MAG: polyprenyl synthetase family protein, partial [Armatimonadota bacterium]|nr:polyprenyl synthetase family protein [Armatimonadota bacterium]
MTTTITSGEGRAAAPPFHLIRRELDQVEKLLLEYGDSSIGLVREISHHILSAGGKRLRPALVVLSARAVGCHDEWPVKLGACMELLHT